MDEELTDVCYSLELTPALALRTQDTSLFKLLPFFPEPVRCALHLFVRIATIELTDLIAEA